MKLHSYLSNKCKIGLRIDGERGVFAVDTFKKNEVISIWGGIIYTSEEIDRISKAHPHFLTHPVSVAEGIYIGPTHFNKLDDVEYMNHSCNPNAGIRGQIMLVARRNIAIGEEICFDYDTTEIDSKPFACNCGSPNCRKIIRGDSWKNPTFQKENWDYLSLYIQEKILNNQTK